MDKYAGKNLHELLAHHSLPARIEMRIAEFNVCGLPCYLAREKFMEELGLDYKNKNDQKRYDTARWKVMATGHVRSTAVPGYKEPHLWIKTNDEYLKDTDITRNTSSISVEAQDDSSRDQASVVSGTVHREATGDGAVFTGDTRADTAGTGGVPGEAAAGQDETQPAELRGQLAANPQLGPGPKSKVTKSIAIPKRLRNKADAAVLSDEQLTTEALKKMIATPVVSTRVKPLPETDLNLARSILRAYKHLFSDNSVMSDRRLEDPYGIVAKVIVKSNFVLSALDGHRKGDATATSSINYVIGDILENIPHPTEDKGAPNGWLYTMLKSKDIDAIAEDKIGSVMQEVAEMTAQSVTNT